jgi:PTH1 family peptidyl-tRNA hydrolase
MFTIVGLGNPGAEYAHTRHNVGWQALMYVIEKEGLPTPHSASVVSGEMVEGTFHGQDIRIAFPHTYMNRSGGAVAKLLGKDLDLPHLIVVHDEIDLPFGTIRVSVGSGAGGHNGVRSLIDSLGSKEFIRIRVGIAQRSLFGTVKRPTGEKLSRFVLSEFGTRETREKEKLEAVFEKVRTGLTLILESGVEKAMQIVNADGPA